MSDHEEKDVSSSDTSSVESVEEEKPKGLQASRSKTPERKRSFTAKGISLISKIIGYQTEESQLNYSQNHDSDKESVHKNNNNNNKKKNDDSSDDESISIPEDKSSVASKKRKSEIGPKLGFVRKVLKYDEFQVSAFAPANSADQAPMWIATWKMFDLPVVLVEVKGMF